MICESCEKHHGGEYGSGRFCNTICARSFSTKLKRASISEKVSLKLRKQDFYPCNKCGLKFDKANALVAHKVSHRISFEELKKDGSRKVRLLRERGHQCETCKLTEWMGKVIPLELDHISGNSDDNKRENLRLLCPNCHAQTPTYKSKNIASFQRKLRSLKYPRSRTSTG